MKKLILAAVLVAAAIGGLAAWQTGGLLHKDAPGVEASGVGSSGPAEDAQASATAAEAPAQKKAEQVGRDMVA
ncbi:MAG: hypothetical protein HDQ92_09145, partial [Desulfovibrio sp.]|nr:hypothetical protein [Desulfovibrio sp.]